MRSSLFSTFAALLAAGWLACVAAGCNDGSDHDSDPNPPEGSEDFTGTFTSDVTRNSQNELLGEAIPSCDDAPSEEPLSLDITIVGSELNIAVNGDGETFHVTPTMVDEDTLRFTRAIPLGSGTRTETVTLDFTSETGGSFDAFTGTGDVQFRQADGENSCDAIDIWTGIKVPGTGLVNLNGTWLLEFDTVENNCGEPSPIDDITVPVTIDHQNPTANIEIPDIGFINGTFNANTRTLRVTRHFIGEIDGEPFTVNASGDMELNTTGNVITGPVTHTFVEQGGGGTPCTVVVEYTLTRIPGEPGLK